MKKNIVSIVSIALCACGPAMLDDVEHYIPVVHFSHGSGWTGEPEGLIFDGGEYHLFYQHTPVETTYGDIRWGHATSKDLIEWQILPISLTPDASGYPESGNIVVDTDNTSRLGVDGVAPFIAFCTYSSKSRIVMLYSINRGVSWMKRDDLVLPDADERQPGFPHVSWSEEFETWIMTASTGSSILFYTSADCMQWEYRSEFEYVDMSLNTWEGSAFLPLRVEGDGETRWVLLVDMVGNGPAEGAPATRYFVGDFDGYVFRPTQTKDLWLDYGKDNYAGTYVDPLHDGEYIGLGWMNCWEYANLLPVATWRGSMTFPRRLSLLEERSVCYLTSRPIPIGGEYSGKTHVFVSTPVELSDMEKVKFDLPESGAPFMLSLEFDNEDKMAIWKAGNYGVALITRSGKHLLAGYRNEQSYYYVDRNGIEPDVSFSDTFGRLMGAYYRPMGRVSDWSLLFDRSSIEFFADEGRIAMTALCYPDEEFSHLEIYAEGGTVTLNEASITELQAK